MIFKLSKNETLNNILNIFLILLLLPTIKTLFELITGVAKGTTELAQTVASQVGVVLSGGTSNNVNDKAKAVAKPIAEDLYEEFNPTSGGLFRTLGSIVGITDVNETKVIEIFNRTKTELEAAYVCYWYAQLYGKSIKKDVLGALNTAEYNKLYIYVRSVLNRMK